jgi:hypothetical protein
MNLPKINYIIDALMVVSFAVTAVTGLIIFFFIPGGVPQGRYQEFIGILKGTWTAVHNWAGIVMVLLVVLHFLLHWKWVVSTTKNLFFSKKKT